MAEKLLTLLHKWPRIIPGCYEVLDKIAVQGGDWPEACKVPLDAAMIPFSKAALVKTLSDQTDLEETLPN